MRILVVGVGVIGSVYAGKLIQSGHEVVLLARGRRLIDLQHNGLLLQDGITGRQTDVGADAVGEVAAGDHFDLVLVAVRAEQLTATVPVLAGIAADTDVLFFGNTGGHQGELTAALGDRTVFGFPAAGGVQAGPVTRYVLIAQQQTMLGEPTGTTSTRLATLQAVLRTAGFPTTISGDIDGWLLGHSAFVVPICFALYRSDTDPGRLAGDRATLRLMVRATRQAFAALQAAGNGEIPANLQWLYQRLPIGFAAAYWRKVMAGPRGELWFGAHARAAPEEMHALAAGLRTAVRTTGHPTPDLETLLADPRPGGTQ